MAWYANKFVRKLVKIVAWLIGCILVLVIILFILVQSPAFQHFAKGKLVSYLEGKLGTKVEIRRVALHFPGELTLENVYFEDQRKDTLLWGGKITVNFSLWKLLGKEIDISRVELDTIRLKVYRPGTDTAFNYDYIIRAFSGPPEKKPVSADTSPSYTYHFGELSLHHVIISYQDDWAGNEFYADLGDFKTDIKTFDPVHAIYSIPDIALSGLTARVRRYKPLLKEPASLASESAAKASADGSIPLSLQLGTINLEHVGFSYLDEIAPLKASINLGTFRAVADKSDWQRLIIRLRELELKNTAIAVNKGYPIGSPAAGQRTAAVAARATPPASGVSPSTDPANWKLELANLVMDNNDLQYDDNSRKKASRGMDYHHLKIGRLALRGDSLQFTPHEYKGRIAAAGLTEQSGFVLRKLSTGFLYNDTGARLENLDLQTGLSEIHAQSLVKYSSLQSLSRSPGSLYMDLSFGRSRIAVRDVLVFVPALAASLKGKEALSLAFSGKLKGPLKDLDIPALELSAPQNTFLSAKGHIRGLPDISKAFFDMQTIRIGTGARDLASLLPAGSIPSNIRIPDSLLASGSFRGGRKAFHTKLALRSSSGSSDIDASLSLADKSYDIEASLDKLNLGYLLRREKDLGAITLRAALKGSGFDYKTLNATLHANMEAGTLKGYLYTGLALEGSLHNGNGVLHAAILDTAIRFNLDLTAGLSKKFPAVKMDWRLDTLDLHALHLLDDTLQCKGTLHADFTDTDPDSLQGSVSINGLSVVTGLQRLATDSIIVLAQRKDDLQEISLHSEMADIDWKGIYKVTETGRALQQTVRHYYGTDSSQNHLGATARNAGLYLPRSFGQDWEINLVARPSPVVLAWMPSLKGTDTIHAHIIFNSDSNRLRLALDAPRIQYGNTIIRKTVFSASADEKQLQYRLQSAGIRSGELQLYQAAVYGYVENNRIFTSLLLEDEKRKDRYRLSGELNKLPSGWKFMLNPDSLLLNYDRWQVSRDNFLRYDTSGIVVNDFRIGNKDESLKIQSIAQTSRSPIDITFHNFQLNTLSKFANQDSLLVDGVLNGKADLKNPLTHPVFTSDLQISHLAYRKDTIGDLSVKVNNEEANVFATELSIEGYGNNVQASGKYYTGEGRMDMKLDLAPINLSSIKPFAFGQLEDIKGLLKGHLAVAGTLDNPLVNGDLHFDSTLVTPVISGEPLKLSNDNIEFDADGFNFNNFSLEDSAGNKATIDGNVYTKDYRDYRFDVSVKAANFRLVNARAASNRSFYGSLNLDAAANLSGDMSSPKVTGGLRVNKKTNFFFILPGSDPEVVDRQGVVRFIDKDHPADTLADRAARTLRASGSDIRGMDISLNIETDSNAVFTMVLDERTGDQLTARGRSNLVFGMDKSGKIDLTGGYEVESGSYNLSLDVLKRKFNIQRGSTITWTGDPTTATLDLTATYAANTPSIDLIANEIAGRSETDINKFKQKLPFLVTLKMEGELLKPKITFDITLPTDILALWPDVDAKLQQIRIEESELNKQVFALLLLNRFVGDDPLQSAAGGGASVGNMAFQSASQILTNQLDQLAGSLIKGVDIHFDLNNQQDFSTGNEQDYTELNVSVSKRLFNERIQVNVGSNFDVMGAGNPNQNASNLAGDVAVDYKLTKDGRYMLRAYRKNQYEAVLEGQVVETGLSFILTFDYNRFREIFGHSREEKPEEKPGEKGGENKTIKPVAGKPSNQ